MIWMMLAAVAGALMTCIYLAQMGVPRSDRELGPALIDVLRRERPDCMLLIQRPFRREFLQVGYFCAPDGRRGLELIFPEVDWSKRFVPLLVREAKATDVACFSEDDEGKTMRFFIFQFLNEAEAEAYIQFALRSVFGFPSSTVYRIRLT